MKTMTTRSKNMINTMVTTMSTMATNRIITINMRMYDSNAV